MPIDWDAIGILTGLEMGTLGLQDFGTKKTMIGEVWARKRWTPMSLFGGCIDEDEVTFEVGRGLDLGHEGFIKTHTKGREGRRLEE